MAKGPSEIAAEALKAEVPGEYRRAVARIRLFDVIAFVQRHQPFVYTPGHVMTLLPAMLMATAVAVRPRFGAAALINAAMASVGTRLALACAARGQRWVYCRGPTTLPAACPPYVAGRRGAVAVDRSLPYLIGARLRWAEGRPLLCTSECASSLLNCPCSA